MQCPDNYYSDFLDYVTGLFSPPKTLTNLGGKCLEIDKISDSPISLQSAKLKSFPTSVTINLWLRITAIDSPNAVYFNAYNIMTIYEASNGDLKFKYKTTS